MQLKSLKIFCDVVSRRSFSRAAAENGITQSGASQVVHQLEKGLGVRLIDRSRRPFVLTPEGQTYFDGCRKVVQQYFALEDEIRSQQHDVAGRVVVASIYSIGLHHMNGEIQRFLAMYPKANVRLEYLHPDAVYKAVEEDAADLGLVSYPHGTKTLESVLWQTEPMVLVCPPGHPIADRDRVPWEALHGERLVCFEPGLSIRREIDAALSGRNVEVQVANEFDNIETIKSAIRAGAGLSLLPLPAVRREIEAGTLVGTRLAAEELSRPLGVIHRRGRELSATARRFMESLFKHAEQDEDDVLSAALTAANDRSGSQVAALSAVQSEQADKLPAR